MQRHIAGIFVVMCASGCTRVIAHDEPARLTAEDAVIRALLVDETPAFSDTLWVRPKLDAQLSDPAEVDETAWIAQVRSMLADVPRRLRDDYVAAQRNERRLVQVPAIAGRVIQFDSTTHLDFSGRPRWVMRISRVGFNAARDSAVVTTSYGCGPLCGRFATVLLARTADGWKIVATLFMAHA
jgi:hypothetical protein